MCIRDSNKGVQEARGEWFCWLSGDDLFHPQKLEMHRRWICLLYTSDAADERSSVDLGGRRIIKKKTIDIKRLFRVVRKKIERQTITKKRQKKKQMGQDI